MRLAIEHHDEEELNELEDLLEEMKEAIASEDPVNRFFDVDDRFHDKIAEMGKNPMADKVNRVVRTLTYAIRFRTVSEMITGGKSEELINAHRLLTDAIREGDKHNLSEKVRGSYFEEELSGK